MKTAHGMLAALAFALLLAAMLFMPMDMGEEDSLVILPGELRMKAGDQYTVRCALSAEDPNQQLYFYTDDARIARIDANGTVLGRSSGETLVHAVASGGAQAQMRVVVSGVPMTRLRLNVSELHISKGEFSGLRVEYNTDASDSRLEWISSDENVVRVDGAGRIEGVGGGEAYVSVLAPNGLNASTKVYVDVAGMAAHVTPNDLKLGVGARVPLRLSLLPSDSTDYAVHWVSSDASVLSVDSNGEVRAVGEGSAYVTVRTRDGLSASVNVRVETAPQGIQINPSEATLERGEAMDMQLMFMRADGTADKPGDHLTQWSSSNENVATVDQSGRVTAVGAGACEIRAASDNMTALCRLRVEINVQEILIARDSVIVLQDESMNPLQLQWGIAPEDAQNPTVFFASDNEAVASVTPEGMVYMTGALGTAKITLACANGVQASFDLRVLREMPTRAPAVTPVPDDLPPYLLNGSAEEEAGVYEGEDIYGDVYEGDDIYDADYDMDADIYGEDMYSDAAYAREALEEDGAIRSVG